MDAGSFLDYLTTNHLPKNPGRMVLTLMLNSRGGIIGDLTLGKLGENHYYLVGATIAEATYLRWMQSCAADYDVRIDNTTSRWSAVGLTGPSSRALLQDLNDANWDRQSFPFMNMREVDIGTVSCRALRVSYSGELGWELHCPVENQTILFDSLMDAGKAHGLALIGSRAMGCLRIEKGYRSWGPELNNEFTPSMAGLDWLCKPEKGDFAGRDAFVAARSAPPKSRLVTLAVDAIDADCIGSEAVWAGNRVGGS